MKNLFFELRNLRRMNNPFFEMRSVNFMKNLFFELRSVKSKKYLFFALAIITLSAPAFASRNPIPDLGFGNEGVVIKHDPSNFEMAIRFRSQFRFTYEDFENETMQDYADFNVRRMRLRFDGTAFDDRFLYKIQLSFTRGDLDFDTFEFPNILRDAVVGWRLTDKSTLWFGQTKLPGNRQRVVSSGNLELVDRSLLNATFTIDRDMGLQWYNQIGDVRPVWLKFAISNGEGRSINNKNKDMSYTARAEWLPLGEFTNDGDYYEGDLAFEKHPKIALGVVYNLNPGTNRVGGQIGRIITDGTDSFISRDLQTFLADFLIKYRGWAFSSEFAARDTDDPIVPISDTENAAIYKGQAVTAQLSYRFANNLAPVVRFTKLFPDDEILTLENERTQYTVGLTKYLNQHQVKLQTDITLDQQRNSFLGVNEDNFLFRIQVEYGI